MVAHGHHEDMASAFLILIIVVAVLALVTGADSRVDDIERRRRYLG